MYTSLSSIYVSLEKTGGLFDIDATLPVLLIQFFLLVQILSLVLFNPIQKILKQREEEIENNLKNARVTLEEVDKLQQKIKKILQSVRDRQGIRVKEVESKRQTALIRSKKYLDTKLRKTRESMVNTYRTKATQADNLIPGVVKEINRYLRVRPPINRL
uniref:ATP synthase CF0 subunit II n=1 Tax=Vischeria sp. ACOI 3415 TaxID=2506143 RepID=A0A410D368_9STRA|nr:ATP synthase CF0 subunit II [Vischeria sp. ACOI 3415]QAA12143.1 ATP synthase CF0 subunit II [Vischeria sp. ACOI 3415]